MKADEQNSLNRLELFNKFGGNPVYRGQISTDWAQLFSYLHVVAFSIWFDMFMIKMKNRAYITLAHWKIFRPKDNNKFVVSASKHG